MEMGGSAGGGDGGGGAEVAPLLPDPPPQLPSRLAASKMTGRYAALRTRDATISIRSAFFPDGDTDFVTGAVLCPWRASS